MIKKTILVPTDFSEPAHNAAEYALSIAKVMDASVLLFHAHHIQPPAGDMGTMPLSSDSLQKTNLDKLNKYKEELSRGVGKGVEMDCLAIIGFAADEIIELVPREHIDMIIMGISGSGKLVNSLLGSVTTEILREVQVPVIIIPEKAKFKLPTKIALAFDQKRELSAKVLNEFKEFMAFFKAELYVIDVETKHPETATADPGNKDPRKTHALEQYMPTFHFPLNKDVIEGLLAFDETHQVDLLVMFPRRHSLLSRIFHPSNTKRMAFYTTTPILALHE
jgi:nucleotide-binding universal stress UspA family protein